MLRVNKHIRVVKLDGYDDEQLHDKFSALALPTVAIEKFTTTSGRAFIRAPASFHLTMSPLSTCGPPCRIDAVVARQRLAASAKVV